MHTKSLFLALFIALKFALQYLAIAPEYELHRDEYLHLDQARHLAWGYLSVPPFTSWVSYLILLLGNGVFWVWLAALLAFWIYPPFRAYRFLFFAFLISMTLFVYLRAKGYYTIGLYPILLAFGAVYLEFLFDKGWGVYLRPIVLAFPVVLFAGMALVVLPMRSPAEIIAHPEQYKNLGLLRWEDGQDHSLPQDFADMQGWRELTQQVDKVYAGLPDKQATLVFCDNYGQAGAINFYTSQGIQAVSMNADYINWINLDQPIHNLILVKEAEDDDPNREAERPAFERVEKVGEIKNSFAREKGTRIYLLEGAKVSIAPILREEIAKRKRGED